MSSSQLVRQHGMNEQTVHTLSGSFSTIFDFYIFLSFAIICYYFLIFADIKVNHVKLLAHMSHVSQLTNPTSALPPPEAKRRSSSASVRPLGYFFWLNLLDNFLMWLGHFNLVNLKCLGFFLLIFFVGQIPRKNCF